MHDTILEMYGVKGMKWGVRKWAAARKKKKAANYRKKQAAKKAKLDAKKLAADEARIQKNKNKKISDLSDKELNELIDRVKIENSLSSSQNASRNDHMKTVSQAADTAKKIIDTSSAAISIVNQILVMSGQPDRLGTYKDRDKEKDTSGNSKNK